MNKFPQRLYKLSKEQLIYKVLQLEKKIPFSEIENKPRDEETLDQRRSFFKRFKENHVAFKIAYLGWNYCGSACSHVLDNSVEVEFWFIS